MHAYSHTQEPIHKNIVVHFQDNMKTWEEWSKLQKKNQKIQRTLREGKKILRELNEDLQNIDKILN